VKSAANQLVRRAVALLETPEERQRFVRAVTSRLQGTAPTVKELRRAIYFVLETQHGIAVGRRALG
jgi:hypothetical protein